MMRLKSRENNKYRILSVAVATILMLATIGASCTTTYAAANGNQANSWRYKNGELITDDASDSTTTDDVEVPKLTTGSGLLTSGSLLGYPSTISAAGAVRKGIDVSYAQGTVDWDAVKAAGIDFVIMRVGYGSEYYGYGDSRNSFAVDSQFYRNASECERLGIPYGIYVFSYAYSVEEAQWEADCAINLAKGHNLSYPIYTDLEDSNSVGQFSSATISAMAKRFCETVEAAGYQAGIYANLNWFNNKVNSSDLDVYEKWVAQWYDYCEYSKTYCTWQCTSDYSVSGISGRVDLDYDYVSVKNRTLKCWRHNATGTAAKAATTSSDGNIAYWYCPYCKRYYSDADSNNEMTLDDTIIKKIASVELGTTSYVYDGTAKEPDVIVKDSAGKELVKGTDYDVEYKNNTNPGEATATVTFKGNYSGTSSLKYTIVPAYTISGTITGNWASVTLVDEDNNEQTVQNIDGTYEFKNQLVGDYTLKVTPNGDYTGREFSVSVEDEDIVQNLLVGQAGDANFDGKLTAEDVTKIARHIAKISEEKDSYLLQFFDTDHSGKEADASDVTHLARYIAQIISEL